MKPSLLQWLACPECSGDLVLSGAEREGEEIVSGGLTCEPCGAQFAIRKGVPRFAPSEMVRDQRATARNFGAQWQMFDELNDGYEEQFRDWIAPVTPAFVKGSLVLEAGCGKGRHTWWLTQWGAAAVIAVDLSDAVDVAYRHVGALPNAHIIQADIYKLPLRPVFDYALSIGVLHHLPRPRDGFAALVRKVRPGGAVSAWVYGQEGNEWIVRFVDPVRRRVTSKLPAPVLYWVALGPAALVHLAAKTVYAPLAETAIARFLPYRDYLVYIARFSFREIHSIVFDHLNAPTAFYIGRSDFESWFHAAGLERTTFVWHNRNSWKGFGVLAARS
jgi:SAM-dependent methyltransferase